MTRARQVANFVVPGADGQVLTSTGSVWNSEAVAAGGKILQVEAAQDSDRTTFSTASGVKVAFTNLVVPITPTSATNTMFVHGVVWYGATNFNGGIGLMRYTTAEGFAAGDQIAAHGQAAYAWKITAGTFVSMDEPPNAGTSYGLYSVIPLTFSYFDNAYDTDTEINYQLYGETAGGVGVPDTVHYVNRPTFAESSGAAMSSIQVFEIQGTVTPT